ncbi:MAG: CFI-box-CTERM domain-containing protein [Planctomycetota bacterium]|nr:CFI-box-CTERM domain-containing protein [Planctomycetota bacterium]
MTVLSSQLLYGRVTAGGVNELIITWRNFSYLNSQLSSQIWCQVILQSSGKIIMQYQSSINSNDAGNGNADPAVGICGPDPLGNLGILACYTRAANNDGYPSAYQAITFVPPPPPPSITVLAPNGGEVFYTGANMVISWTVANGPLPGADIAISTDGGFTYSTIATNVTDNNGGTYTWTISSAPSTTCFIRVSDTTLITTQDVSDSAFEIRTAPPGFTITSPGGTGNLDFVVGDVMTISWTAVGAVGTSVSLAVSRDQGINWTTIATGINPKVQSSYNWTVTAPHTDGIRSRFIRIQDALGNLAISAPPFAIFDVPIFDLTSPDGSETVFVDTPTTILWNTQGLVGFFVTIELSRDGGVNWETVSGGTNNDGIYEWTPTLPATSTAKIRISTSYGGTTYSDMTAGLFTITETAALAVTAPNGGEEFTVGDRTNITWNSRGTGVGNVVKIEISRDGGQTFETIIDAAQNVGYYSWKVTGPITQRALISISPVNNPTANDVSDGTFVINAERGIYILSPVGGEAYYLSQVLQVQWFTSGVTGLSVSVELSRDGGNSWTTLSEGTPNDGTFTWVVDGDLSENCLMRVTSVQYPEFFTTSPGSFRISELVGTIFIEPFKGQIWERGTYRSVRWNPGLFDAANVRVEIMRKGEGWEVIAITTENDGVYEWFVSGVSEQCQVRLSSLLNLAKNYVSEPFMIIERYSIEHEALGRDHSAESGENVPFSFIVNPGSGFNSFATTLTYDPSVFAIPEPQAVIKGGAFSGWSLNVNYNNTTGTVTVIMNGTGSATMPAEAFTINFTSLPGMPGQYTVGIDTATFDGTATSSTNDGKITLTPTEDPAVGDGSGDGGGGGGCFIATSAFGSMAANAVTALCGVRDSALANSEQGTSLVAMYYELSPAMAESFTEPVRAFVRELLN